MRFTAVRARIAHPYNAYHWLDSAGQTVVVALNVSGPTTLGSDYVQWVDLVERLLLLPDERQGYRVELLGEDDVPDVDEATYRHIEAALDELLATWPERVRFLAEHSRRLWAAQR